MRCAPRADLPRLCILHWRIKYCANKSIIDRSIGIFFIPWIFCNLFLRHSNRVRVVYGKTKRMCFFFGFDQFHCWSSNSYNISSSPLSLTTSKRKVFTYASGKIRTNDVFFLNTQIFDDQQRARRASADRGEPSLRQLRT